MISKPIKLIYEEGIRFSEHDSTEQKKNEQQFGLTCSCGEKFLVPLDVVGNAAPCPKCGSYVKISDEDFMPLTCGCGKSLRIPRLGDVKKCPSCKKPVKLLTMQLGQNEPERPAFEIPAVINTTRIEPPKKFELKLDIDAEEPKKDLLKIRCTCGQKLAVPVSISHKSIECPRCHNRFKLTKKTG